MSAGVAFVALFVSSKPVTGSFALSASCSFPVAGASYATVTVSTRSSSSPSVSTTVAPSTATAPLAASGTSRSVVPRVAFTVNALATGTDVSSRSPSKVTVSSSPSTDAEEYVGGVLLVAGLPLDSAASLPERSLSRCASWFVCS